MTVYYRGEALRKMISKAVAGLPFLPRNRIWEPEHPLPKTQSRVTEEINGREVTAIAQWVERITLDGPAPTPMLRWMIDGKRVTRDRVYVLCGTKHSVAT